MGSPRQHQELKFLARSTDRMEVLDSKPRQRTNGIVNFGKLCMKIDQDVSSRIHEADKCFRTSPNICSYLPLNARALLSEDMLNFISNIEIPEWRNKQNIYALCFDCFANVFSKLIESRQDCFKIQYVGKTSIEQ